MVLVVCSSWHFSVCVGVGVFPGSGSVAPLIYLHFTFPRLPLHPRSLLNVYLVAWFMIPELGLSWAVEQLLMFLCYWIVTFSLPLVTSWTSVASVMQTVILTLPSQHSTTEPGTMNKQYFVFPNKNRWKVKTKIL